MADRSPLPPPPPKRYIWPPKERSSILVVTEDLPIQQPALNAVSFNCQKCYFAWVSSAAQSRCPNCTSSLIVDVRG